MQKLHPYEQSRLKCNKLICMKSMYFCLNGHNGNCVYPKLEAKIEIALLNCNCNSWKHRSKSPQLPIYKYKPRDPNWIQLFVCLNQVDQNVNNIICLKSMYICPSFKYNLRPPRLTDDIIDIGVYS
jgi:hypothetical protein